MTSSSVCNINTCKRSSRALCNCCQQYLCLNHLTEHSDFLNDQLIPLSDEINQLSDRFNTVCLLDPFFLTQLDTWCQEAHRTVDRFYEKKKREFEEIVHKQQNKQKIELDQLRELINELIQEQEATQEHINSINDSIRSLQQQTKQIHFPPFTLSPLIIDDQLVVIHQKISKSKAFLPLYPPYETIEVQVDWCSVAANENLFLVKQNSKLCLLDRQLRIQTKIQWIHDNIWDMFWSKTLAQFILITSEEIFMFNERTLTIERFPLGCNGDRDNWSRGTCSNDILFLSTSGCGLSIYEYTLQPSIQFVKEYRSPISCTNDEYIDDLSLNNQALALVIEHHQRKGRLDVCSPTTFDRYWSLEFNINLGYDRIRCCSLKNEHWMVIDPNNSELLQISKDEKLIKNEHYCPIPSNGVLFGNDVLAIVTKESVNLHALS